MSDALELARRFHDAYERLAPSFGYETRQDTKVFDPASANGKLMIAVCADLTTPDTRDALIKELVAALRVAGIRIGICADRMEGCNADGGDHQLVFEVREWVDDTHAALTRAREAGYGAE